MTVKKKSGCKVNLMLNILGRREDGFHELETLMLPVPVYDELSFDEGNEGIRLTCSDPGLPTDSSNLIWKAAEAFFHRAGLKPSIGIHLEKRIPTAAGLGGGSGNAATTLLALNEMHSGALDDEALDEICAGLGSDVNFFLRNLPSLAFGRGEQVEVLSGAPALEGHWLMLVNPGFGVSTPWAYKNLARFPEDLNGRKGRAAELADQLRDGGSSLGGLDLYNSLEAPVLEKYPILVMLQEKMIETGAARAMMSGSGATTFALFETEDQARKSEQTIREHFGPAFWTSITAL